MQKVSSSVWSVLRIFVYCEIPNGARSCKLSVVTIMAQLNNKTTNDIAVINMRSIGPNDFKISRRPRLVMTLHSERSGRKKTSPTNFQLNCHVPSNLCFVTSRQLPRFFHGSSFLFTPVRTCSRHGRSLTKSYLELGHLFRVSMTSPNERQEREITQFPPIFSQPTCFHFFSCGGTRNYKNFNIYTSHATYIILLDSAKFLV